MKRTAAFMISVFFVLLFLAPPGSAWYSSSSQYQSSSGCAWDPWYGTQCGYSQSYSQQSTVSSGPGYWYPWGWGYGGSYYNSYSSWNFGNWGFFANGSQIEDVSGVWETDLLGIMNLKLTGDDIIRGSYMHGEDQGYIQGNFSYSNETLPMMNGIWWEAPVYEPPYSAGVIEITFLNSTALKGVFSYADGTWGPFNGIKVSGSLSEDTEEMLLEMPEVNWTLNYDQKIEYLVHNPSDENPIMQSGQESFV